ncbi:MAG: DUF1611 domain-containing protein [Planctomycetota bacterium]|jgi:uncharacterized NAD-dependent epimerase/dehydratase family protein
MTRRMIILTEGLTDPLPAKTATCLLRYRAEEVVALLDSTLAGQTAEQHLGVGDGVPIVASVEDAPEANTLVIGVAPPGGRLPEPMRRHVDAAIARGMRVESGMHEFLSDDPHFAAAARASGAELIDVRKNDEHDVAQRKDINETCLRIQTVGHDCSVGKMVAAIEVANALKAVGHDAKFVATGQTGILVEGSGCPIDCVVADFINGAAEKLVLANQHHGIILIEGQGSLVQPRYSSVTLGLLHGCVPDGLIMTYEPGRTQTHNMAHIPIPPLGDIIRLFESCASVMHPCRVIGVAMNSRRLTDERAEEERQKLRDEFGLPVCDVIRHGADELARAVLDLKQQIGK